MIVLGLAISILSGWMIFTAMRTISWRSTTGTILSGRIDSTVSGAINVYEPVLEYRYIVDGQVQTDNRYTLVPTDEDGTKEWARAILAAHPVGSTCRVWYNPRNPKQSVLRRGPRGGFYFITIFFLIMILLIGLPFVLFDVRFVRRNEVTPLDLSVRKR